MKDFIQIPSVSDEENIGKETICWNCGKKFKKYLKYASEARADRAFNECKKCYKAYYCYPPATGVRWVGDIPPRKWKPKESETMEDMKGTVKEIHKKLLDKTHPGTFEVIERPCKTCESVKEYCEEEINYVPSFSPLTTNMKRILENKKEICKDILKILEPNVFENEWFSLEINENGIEINDKDNYGHNKEGVVFIPTKFENIELLEKAIKRSKKLRGKEQ